MSPVLHALGVFAALWGVGFSRLGEWFYSLWSGIVGDLTLASIPVTWWAHHNCHVKGCMRMGHPHEGRVACRRHFKEVHHVESGR